MDFKQQAADQAVQHTSTFVGSKLATRLMSEPLSKPDQE